MIRTLAIVLGDQLNLDSALFDGLDPQQDAIWMAEVVEESTHVPSHPQRIVLFLSAMRHFAAQLRDQAWCVHYQTLDDKTYADFEQALSDFLHQVRVQQVQVVLPGEARVLHRLKAACEAHQIRLNVLADRYFMALPGEFKTWLAQRKKPTMEYWYRALRQRTGILMQSGKPVGGRWNYDADNREAFAKQGPPPLTPPLRFEPDALTQAVMALVAQRFGEHAGNLNGFDWPVTREQALCALDDFVRHRLALFGRFQDAMWPNQAWLFHSLLSAALNVKLLNPREVIQAALEAYEAGAAPLNAVEGFVRQILGWREYVRGLYWAYQGEWLQWNALAAQADLPRVYWHGDTDMACMREAVGQVLRYGYGHHIQRLMVTGLFALLWGVQPKQVHEWYLAMFVDAIAWVEMPNVIGMSQFADGGLMASKPYIASGQYIHKMSGYCAECRFNPKQAEGAQACPFTTLYWAFIDRHQAWLSTHPRLAMQVKHWLNMSAQKREAILRQAQDLRRNMA